MPFYPNLRKEKKLWKQGYQYIAGLDEAGRGSWAGPLVAGAVILNPKIKIKGIADSKKLRSPLRQKAFEEITNHAIAWAIGIVEAAEIDKIGLGPANILAMQRALENLKISPHYFLADGLIKINFKKIMGESIVDGDHKIKSVAAASIIAKVFRDDLMNKLDEKFPAYGFKQHKGYGTNHHFQMLVEHGACNIHRRSFKPVQDLIK